jgi:ABC-2 type transport system ATP-binding protein
MNAKLRIAATLARKAKLTLLDEPLNGVDFKAREQIVEMILRQADESRTIVMSTHLIEEIESYVEEAIFIKGGKLADVVNLERERMTTGRSLTELYMQLM